MAKQFKSKEELLIELEELKLENQVLKSNLNKNLPENEERFKYLADIAPVLIWTSGIDALCIYFTAVQDKLRIKKKERKRSKNEIKNVKPKSIPSVK